MVKGFKTSVKFEENSRLEFVQEMCKRKEQRRKEAQNQIKLKLKKERKANEKRKKELQLAEIADLNRIEEESELVNKEVANSFKKTAEKRLSSIPGVTIGSINFDTNHLTSTAPVTFNTTDETDDCLDGKNEEALDEISTTSKSNRDQLKDLKVSYKKMVKDRVKKQKNKMKKKK